MRSGRRWLALDADFYTNDFTARLTDQFGLAGAALWVAFLCACKRHEPPGQIVYGSEPEGLNLLGVAGHTLANNQGETWVLEDFWTFTGRMKQTKKTARGQLKNVQSTHWERWQDDERRMKQRERQSRWRGQTRDKHATNTRQPADSNVTTDTDTDTDINLSPLPPTGTASRNSTSDGRRGNGHHPPKDPLIDWIQTCIPGTGNGAARQTLDRLRHAGIGDIVIEEAAGYAAQNGANTARYIEQVAADWMAQRDPTWNPHG